MAIRYRTRKYTCDRSYCQTNSSLHFQSLLNILKSCFSRFDHCMCYARSQSSPNDEDSNNHHSNCASAHIESPLVFIVCCISSPFCHRDQNCKDKRRNCDTPTAVQNKCIWITFIVSSRVIMQL